LISTHRETRVWSFKVPCKVPFQVHVANNLRHFSRWYIRHYCTSIYYYYFFGTFFISAFFPFRLVPPPGGRLGAVGSRLVQRPGTNFGCSRHWSDDELLHVFLLVGVIYGGTPGSTGRTCKLHTERPFFFLRDSPPGPGGNRTQDLLVVRQQLYH